MSLVGAVAPHSEHGYGRIEAEFGSARLFALLAELHDFASLDLENVETGDPQ